MNEIMLGKKRKITLAVWDVRNTKTVSHSILHQYNHLFIFAPLHGLLEYARIFDFEPKSPRPKWWK